MKKAAVLAILSIVLVSCRTISSDLESGVSEKTDGQQTVRPATVEVVPQEALK